MKDKSESLKFYFDSSFEHLENSRKPHHVANIDLKIFELDLNYHKIKKKINLILIIINARNLSFKKGIGKKVMGHKMLHNNIILDVSTKLFSLYILQIVT